MEAALKRLNIRYALSKVIPVPMRSTYRIEVGETPLGKLAEWDADTPMAVQGDRVTTTWWQWRDHVWAVRTVRV